MQRCGLRSSPPPGPSRGLRAGSALLALSGLLLACEPEPLVHAVDLPGGHTLRYWQVASERVSRTEFVFEFAASLESGAGRATPVGATVASADPSTVLEDAGLRFGPGAAGEETPADDPFRLRQDRRAPFDPARLAFRLLDRFGGDLARSTPATGRFRLDVVDGRHVFVTPDGHPFFSAGLNHITWRGDYSPPIDRRPYHEAVLAKYGDQATWAAATADRLRAWNLNTVGAWSNDDQFPGLPYTPILSLHQAAPAVPGWPTGQTGKAIRDYFDPAFAANLPGRADRAVACAADPWCVGVFADNELPFGPSVLQIGTYVDAYLTLPPGAPGKQALQAFFEERYGGDLTAFNAAWSLSLGSFDEIQTLTALEGDAEFCNEAGRRADRQAFTARAASRYFEGVGAALDAISPELLFLGTRFLAVFTAPAIYEAAAPHVDVVSINDYDWDQNGRGLFRSEGTPYGYLFLDDPVSDLATVHDLTGKPLMITEWTIRTPTTDAEVLFPPFIPTVETQAQRADRYQAFMDALLERPYLVGSHWFKFHDQPATGRGDGENSRFGAVDITDEPYPELTERMAAVNARLYEEAPGGAVASGSLIRSAVAAAGSAAAGEPLGLRRLSVAAPDDARTGFFVFILPGTNLALSVAGDDLLLDAGIPDADGIAPLVLAEDALLVFEVVTGELACLELQSAGSAGSLDCDGGSAHDVDVSLATGALALADAVTTTGLGGDAGPGGATLQVTARFTQLPAGATPAECPAALAAQLPFPAALSSAVVTSTKGATTFETAGEPFACGADGALWRGEDGPGMWALGLPLYDSRVPDGDLAASLRMADRDVACRP